jgi:hypothetical protein
MQGMGSSVKKIGGHKVIHRSRNWALLKTTIDLDFRWRKSGSKRKVLIKIMIFL